MKLLLLACFPLFLLPDAASRVPSWARPHRDPQAGRVTKSDQRSIEESYHLGYQNGYDAAIRQYKNLGDDNKNGSDIAIQVHKQPMNGFRFPYFAFCIGPIIGIMTVSIAVSMALAGEFIDRYILTP